MTTPSDSFVMDCARAQDLIFDLVDAEALPSVSLHAGGFPDDTRSALTQHLLGCDACRHYQRTMGHLAGSLAELEDMPFPSGLDDRIMARIALENQPQDAPSRMVPLFGTRGKRYAPLAAAVLVVAIAIPLLLRGSIPQHAATPADPSVAKTTRQTSPAPAKEPAVLASLPTTNENGTQEASGMEPDMPSMQDSRYATDALHAASSQPVAANHPAAPNNLSHTADRPPSPARTTQAVTQPSGDASDTQTDAPTLASALPSSLSQPFGDANLSSEDDVYYDPVSNLVGF